MIAAKNTHALAFDNVSGLPAWLSDAFCRLASGGSLAVRQLYSDDAEVLFEASQPMLLNGIEDVIGRPDLADRAIVLTLPPISDAQRRPEAELWAEFEQARPSILGPCLKSWRMALRGAPACVAGRFRVWRISRSGRPPAKQRCGPLALSHAPMGPIAKPSSKA